MCVCVYCVWVYYSERCVPGLRELSFVQFVPSLEELLYYGVIWVDDVKCGDVGTAGEHLL